LPIASGHRHTVDREFLDYCQWLPQWLPKCYIDRLFLRVGFRFKFFLPFLEPDSEPVLRVGPLELSVPDCKRYLAHEQYQWFFFCLSFLYDAHYDASA